MSFDKREIYDVTFSKKKRKFRQTFETVYNALTEKTLVSWQHISVAKVCECTYVVKELNLNVDNYVHIKLESIYWHSDLISRIMVRLGTI